MSDSLVSLAEAARRLTEQGDKVDRSTLSRYVRQYGDELRPGTRGRETVVDFDLLAEHRLDNDRVTAQSESLANKAKAVEQTGKIRAERLRIELDLGEKQALLTVVREVENAAHAAVGVMRNALSQAAGDTAEAIAKACRIEASAVRPHIRVYERMALEAFIRGLSENKVVRREDLQAGDGKDPVAGGEGPAQPGTPPHLP